LLGLAWFALLLATGDLLVFTAGFIAGVASAVWICGRAERALEAHDPPSIVLDEIVALPLCYVGWLIAESTHGALPEPVQLLRHPTAWIVIAGFIAFRFFDVRKPWPIRQVQSLPGGFGVVADDVLAAVWVNGISLPLLLVLPPAP
jgi:phosphatidylglycerophosphatase A